MTTGDIDGAMNIVEAALQSMTSSCGSARLAELAYRSADDVRLFAHDAITSGVGKLVDADMEQESSKLSALQTQQQLAVQSLSIANSSSQTILSLFR
jgi:flagellin